MTAPAEGGGAQREQAFRDWCRYAYDRVFVPPVTEIDAFNAGYVAGQAATVEEARQHLRDAFAAGRASERAAIVAWLRGEERFTEYPIDADPLLWAADRLAARSHDSAFQQQGEGDRRRP